MSDLSLANFVNISVSSAPRGLSAASVNVLAYFTKETPVVVPPEGYAIYLSATDVGKDWGTDSDAYRSAVAVFSQTPNVLSGGGAFVIIPMLTLETLTDAIERGLGLVPFVGFIAGFTILEDEIKDASNATQALGLLYFTVASAATVLNTGNLFAEISDRGNTNTRMLLYTDADEAPLMAAAYASRAMSTDFAGSNTTSTMNGKDLVTIARDPLITQTILDKCGHVGADVYAGFSGIPKVFTSGGNDFFDNVYNLIWAKRALEIAGFNALVTTATKVPQTEEGMNTLKGAYRSAMEQGKTNGMIAPGEWNSPDTFGNPEDFRRNIRERGYYIYSMPVTQQSQADREERKAPLVQIALKLAGAIHSSDVLVIVNR